MLVERKICPSCNQANFVKLHETPYSDKGLAEFLGAYYTKIGPIAQAEALQGGAFVILKCRDCGLYFQRDVPDDIFSAEIYGSWLDTKSDPLAPDKLPMPMEYYSLVAAEVMQIIIFLQRKNKTYRRLRFLDFGQGWGYWAQMVRSFGVDVYGIELSPEKIAYAKSVGLSVVEISDLQERQFDFINTEQVIEHMAEPRKIVEMLKKLLAPGGVIKLSVPDGKGMASTLHSWNWTNGIVRKDAIMPVQPLEHLNCFTSESLTNMAGLCGLKRVRFPLTTCYAYSTGWSSLKLSARNILRPIKRFAFNKGCYALFSQDDLTLP